MSHSDTRRTCAAPAAPATSRLPPSRSEGTRTRPPNAAARDSSDTPGRRGTTPAAHGTSADSPRPAEGRSSPHTQATTPGGRKWIAHLRNLRSANFGQRGQLQIVDRGRGLADAIANDHVADGPASQPVVLHGALRGDLVQMSTVGQIPHRNRRSSLSGLRQAFPKLLNRSSLPSETFYPARAPFARLQG